MTPQSFYIVWNPDGRNPQFRHASESAATAEAVRLAGAHPDQTFIVLASIGEARSVAVSWTPHAPGTDDDHPF